MEEPVLLLKGSHLVGPIQLLLTAGILGRTGAQIEPEVNHSTRRGVCTIKSILDSAVSSEARMGLSLVRLHSHDCFVNASHRLIFHSLIFFCFCCIIFLFANVCKCGNGCDCGRLGYWAVVVFLFLNFPYSLDPNRN